MLALLRVFVSWSPAPKEARPIACSRFSPATNTFRFGGLPGRPPRASSTNAVSWAGSSLPHYQSNPQLQRAA